MAATETLDPDAAALATPFVKALVRIIRAQDTYGAWDNKPDAALITDYVVTREQRRAIPILGDPAPELLWRLEQFWGAVAMGIEEASGHSAGPMMTLHREGFGRVVLIAGRLVVVSKHLRDVHRFGFDSLAALAAEGTRQVEAGVEFIRRYPEVAEA